LVHDYYTTKLYCYAIGFLYSTIFHLWFFESTS